MKVTGQQPHKASELTGGKVKGKADHTAPPRPQPNPEPEGAGNRATQTLNRIKEAIRNEPDVRAERVAEIQAKVKQGTYKVDADKVAEKMINTSLKEDLERP